MKALLLPMLLAVAGISDVASAAAPGRRAPADAVLKAEIAARYAIKKRAYQTGDAALLAREFYSQDAIIFGDDGTPADIGAAEIEADYKSFLPDRSDMSVRSIRTEVSRDGTLAYDLVHFQAISPTKKLPAETILFVWGKRAGKWRCVAEMYVHHTLPPR